MEVAAGGASTARQGSARTPGEGEHPQAAPPYSLQQAVHGVEVLQHGQRALRPESSPESCGERWGA